MALVKDWIEEWNNLYPEDAYFSGRKLKSPIKYCITKMEKFCEEHPRYTKAIIFEATNNYLQQQKQRNWDYTKQSTYFISKKNEPSLLEQYCEEVVGKIQNKQNYEFYPDNDFI